jgi:cytochrome oxidase Cu insertion factor (SCO1/SenC/PrrC family)
MAPRHPAKGDGLHAKAPPGNAAKGLTNPGAREQGYNAEGGESLISEGTPAPVFTLKDQFGREISLSDFRDRQHVLLLFYPLDWTPT